jgi:hypothetical protein
MPAALGAYSFHERLATAWTGALIRVRRGSDNAEQDIGYASGTMQLDTAALLTFTGAGDGFVTTAYDQSGNSRNYTQSTAARQPQIVTAGVVKKSGSNVTASNLAANSNDGLARSDTLGLSGDHDLTMFWMGKFRSLAAGVPVAILGANADGYTIGYNTGSQLLSTWGTNPGNNLWTGAAGTNYQYIIASYDAAANGDALYQNGNTLSHTTYATAAISLANTAARQGYGFGTNDWSTYIVWGSVLGSTDRGTLNTWAEVRRLVG